MRSSAALLTTVLLALSTAATPLVSIRDAPVTLPLSKKLNLAGGGKAMVKAAQARAKALRSFAEGKAHGKASSLHKKDGINQDATDQVTSYVASIGVGNPPTTYTLLVDSGSANTWVGAGKPYAQTSTSYQTPNSVSVNYGSGSFTGREHVDQVTLTPELVIRNQSIGVASKSTDFDGLDGILGIGPVELSKDTLSPDSDATIPTVTDNLFAQGLISANQIGMSFIPTVVEGATNGILTWGGVDSSRYIGDIKYTPITKTSPASNFWGIDQSIRYGETAILPMSAGIVDSGTSLILIASDAFSAYRTATGAVPDEITGLLRLNSDQYNNLQSLFFTIGDIDYELTPNAQIWPRALNAHIGGQSDAIYLVVSDIGTPSGEGLDFINGVAFHERFYTVLDTTNRQVGLALTPHTDSTIN